MSYQPRVHSQPESQKIGGTQSPTDTAAVISRLREQCIATQTAHTIAGGVNFDVYARAVAEYNKILSDLDHLIPPHDKGMATALRRRGLNERSQATTQWIPDSVVAGWRIFWQYY